MAADYKGADEEQFQPVKDDGSPMLRAGPAEIKVVSALTSCLKLSKMYSVENVVVRESLEEFHHYLSRYLSLVDALTIQIGNDRVYVNSAAVKMGAAWLTEFLGFMERVGVSEMIFQGEWSYSATEAMLIAFSSDQGAPPEEQLKAIARRVAEIPAPARLNVSDEQVARATASGEEDLSDAALGTYYYARLQSLMEETHAALRRGESLDAYKRYLRHTLIKLIAGMRATFFEQRLVSLTGLAPSESDPLASHATNVAVLSIAMGRLLDLEDGELSNLGFAALFHDVGRTLAGRFPASPGETADPVRASQHVSEGLRLALAGGLGDAELARIIVIQEHHRVLDGFPASKGLPAPYLLSRIVAVADAFDKLQNGTPWRPAVNPAEALRMLLRTEAAAERPVAELLRDVIGLTPRGTVLELKDGALVLVMDGGARWGHRPVVRRLFLAPGKPDPARTLLQIKNLSAEVACELDPEKVHVDWRREIRTW